MDDGSEERLVDVEPILDRDSNWPQRPAIRASGKERRARLATGFGARRKARRRFASIAESFKPTAGQHGRPASRQCRGAGSGPWPLPILPSLHCRQPCCESKPVTGPICHHVAMAAQKPVAFVTGASSGIGRLIATNLTAGGIAVAGFSRSGEALGLGHAADEMTGLSGYAVDVTQPSEVQRVFAKAIADIGVPSLLVTCAGSAEALGPVASVDPDQWWQTVSVDLRGTMLCSQAVLPGMLAAGAGRIVTIYGNLGDDGRENLSAFAAAKAGVARFTETLASELVGSGVTAVCLHPGFVQTAMTEHLALSEAGRQWLPDFGPRARDHWGDGTSAVALVKRLSHGEGDALHGRIIYAADDLDALATRAGVDASFRRLRVRGA